MLITVFFYSKAHDQTHHLIGTQAVSHNITESASNRLIVDYNAREITKLRTFKEYLAEIYGTLPTEILQKQFIVQQGEQLVLTNGSELNEKQMVSAASLCVGSKSPASHNISQLIPSSQNSHLTTTFSNDYQASSFQQSQQYVNQQAYPSQSYASSFSYKQPQAYASLPVSLKQSYSTPHASQQPHLFQSACFF